MLRVALLFEYPTLNGGERSMLAALKETFPGAEITVTFVDGMKVGA